MRLKISFDGCKSEAHSPQKYTYSTLKLCTNTHEHTPSTQLNSTRVVHGPGFSGWASGFGLRAGPGRTKFRALRNEKTGPIVHCHTPKKHRLFIDYWNFSCSKRKILQKKLCFYNFVYLKKLFFEILFVKP